MTNQQHRRIEAIYDNIAPSWDARQGMVERWFMGHAMREALANNLQGDVLEIGTGTGPTLRLLAGNTRITSFTGIDLSSGMLDEARKIEVGSDIPIVLRQMDAEHLEFPDANFDSVTTTLTLCTVPDPERALLEMARVCKPDGRIVLLEHVLAPNPLVAGMLKLLAPLQQRVLACHLDRHTDHLVRRLGFSVIQDDSKFLGIFRLIVAQPPIYPGNLEEAAPA